MLLCVPLGIVWGIIWQDLPKLLLDIWRSKNRKFVANVPKLL